MAIIISIKQKILELDPGSFQALCDEYLSQNGYPNIVSLGTKAGTQKTTLGTPDTYFTTPDGKYIFVEYTTQQEELFAKIKDDINKCLDTSRTGIIHDKISEIIYCHTSSNLTPFQDQEIRKLCEDVGIKLIVIGIDKLSEDLYHSHLIITRDFLGISICTGQILSYEDFIHDYDRKRLAAPLDTQFMFRDKEMDCIEEAYKKVDIVVLSGAAGTGKTRLALHYGKHHSETNDETLFCIQNNNLAIYEDLKLFIDKPGNYFLIIDDANQLSGLQHIVRYTTMKPEGYHVKILITARDYALQKVKKTIAEYSYFEEVPINIFKDEEIKKLLETALSITNPKYYERIIRISEGNARIAMLAGRIACDSQRLESLSDLSKLYDDYYGAFLEEQHLLANKSICISAGIVAFLSVIHLDYIDPLIPLLEDNGMRRETFIENLRLLHEQEIVDICNDKAIRISEQCLSNYLLKHVFCDKKYIRLSVMIRTCLEKYKERTITSINALLSLYRNQDLYDYIESEIKSLWNELSQEESPYFFEFVKAFYLVNPTESLIILKKKIEAEEKVVLESSDIDTKTGKNYQSVTNNIIEMLGGFADTDHLETALELFFQYYLKRPDLYMEFYHAITSYFNIKRDSSDHAYSTQIAFWRNLIEATNDWKLESVIILMLDVAKEFLKLQFFHAEDRRKNTVTFCKIPLVLSEGVESYRTLIWQSLSHLCSIDSYRLQVRKLLSYEGPIEKISIPVIQFDLPHIETILHEYFPAQDLQNCLLANELFNIYSRQDIPHETLFTQYSDNESFRLYKLLKGPDYSKGLSVNERDAIKRQSIEKHVSSCDFETFKKLIDVCTNIDNIDGHSAWQISGGLALAFNCITNHKELYTAVIKYYIENDTPCNLHPYQIISSLFVLIPVTEVYKTIICCEYTQKNAWQYAFYHELPHEAICAEHLKGLYSFLSDTSDKSITSSTLRDVDFLEKYCIVDADAFITGCRIILAKMEYSPFIVRMYFELLFNHIHNNAQSVIEKFVGNFALLENIYFSLLSHDTIHDYNGEFLKELYLVMPSILEKYINYVVENSRLFNFHNEMLTCFFELENYIEIYNEILCRLIESFEFPVSSVPPILESIILPIHDKPILLKNQDAWIRECIQLYSNEIEKMICLFTVLSKIKNSRKSEYISLFLKYNSSFEDFKRLPIEPKTCSWSGSAMPVFHSRIEFLESLLPLFSGLKWIDHRRHIETMIDHWKVLIRDEQIQEMIRG